MTALSYNQRRKRLIAYGRWHPWVDAAPVRDHVRAQMAAGLGWERQAELADVSGGLVSKLLYAKRGRPPTVRMRPDKAARLLAVRADLDTLSPYALVTATGTRRRLQGLVWLGYSERRISAMLSDAKSQALARDTLRADRISVATARAVRDLSTRLETTPPRTSTKGDRISVARARAKARRAGWVPLAAWDDIDDPTAVPDLGPDIRATAADKAAEIEHLTSLGVPHAMACEQVGIKPATLTSIRWRAAAREAAA